MSQEEDAKVSQKIDLNYNTNNAYQDTQKDHSYTRNDKLGNSSRDQNQGTGKLVPWTIFAI